jgi:hypothetical protein
MAETGRYKVKTLNRYNGEGSLLWALPRVVNRTQRYNKLTFHLPANDNSRDIPSYFLSQAVKGKSI